MPAARAQGRQQYSGLQKHLCGSCFRRFWPRAITTGRRIAANPSSRSDFSPRKFLAPTLMAGARTLRSGERSAGQSDSVAVAYADNGSERMTMSVGTLQNQTGAQLLERIVESPQNIVLLEVAQPASVVDQLRLVARRSGQALYLWQHDTGMLSLREGDMLVPGSKRLTDALRFVRRSMHFGIYLVDANIGMLRTPDLAALLQIARLRAAPSRRVVLMAPELVVHENLEPVSLRLNISGGDRVRPRLRDGRWVQ